MIHKVAALLWEAQANQKPITPITQEFPNLTVDDAYAISSINFKRKISEKKALFLGRKIGLTSLAVQQQLGVQQPDFGYLSSDMKIEDGGDVPRAQLIQPRAEGEVAFVLNKDIPGPKISEKTILDATDYVTTCIEIIDSRIVDWKIKIHDTVADNASSAYFVLGNVKKRPHHLDLRMSGMTLWKNGEVTSTGVGAACMGHPIHAVVWLASAMSMLGSPLKAGEIILSGAYGPVVPFDRGDECGVEIHGLGKAHCRFS